MLKKYLLFCIVCLLLAACAKVNDASFGLPDDPELGSVPSNNIKRWIRFNVLGDRDYPPPIIWFSEKSFDRVFPEFLITLNDAEYLELEKYIKINKCPILTPTPGVRGLLQITNYRNENEEVLCVLSSEKVCSYLSGIHHLNGIHWNNEKWMPMALLSRGYSCESMDQAKH